MNRPDDGDKLAWVAGETSGDLIAAPVVAQLNAQIPSLSQYGVGGPQMSDAGLDAIGSIDALSVRGYAEVLGSLPRLLKFRRDIGDQVLRRGAKAFVGVDAPDFNFRLEARLKAAGMPTVHFIGPSVWAWRRGRLKGISKAVSHMLLLFPFEKRIYDKAGIDATFVGHPMADQIDPAKIDRSAARKALGLNLAKPVVALLPGSRGSEIRYMAQDFIDAAAWLHSQRRDVQFVLAAATPSLFKRLKDMVDSSGVGDKTDLLVTNGQVRTVLSAADTVLAASGTVTLETALMQRPMVIAYRMSPTSYQIMRRMGYLPYVGLPNILCDDWVVPEYIQAAATPAALGNALLEQLDDESARKKVVDRFADLHAKLAIDCAARATEVISRYVAN